MKTTAKILFALVIPLLFCKCASLTKSQLTEVNQFGQLTKNFSTYPGSLYSSYLAIHEKALMYSANATTGAEEHFQLINSAYRLKKKMDSLEQKMDLTFQIVDNYGQSLVLLTSPTHSAQLDTASQSLGTNLDGLIAKYNSINTAHPLPTGIGGAISELITLGGEQYIRSRQADEVKAFVQKADPMIAELMDELTNHLQSPLNSPAGQPATFLDLLKSERDEVHQDYTFYLGYNADLITIQPASAKKGQVETNIAIIKTDPRKSKRQDTVLKGTLAFPAYSGAIQKQRASSLASDQDCFQMLADLDNLDSLYNQTLVAIGNLKKAHHKLLADIQEKKTLKEIVAELQEYGDDVKKMYTTLKAIKN
jgi:hypothetical protein